MGDTITEVFETEINSLKSIVAMKSLGYFDLPPKDAIKSYLKDKYDDCCFAQMKSGHAIYKDKQKGLYYMLYAK